MTCLYAQDDLDALLKNMGDQQKPAAEKPAEPAPAPAAEKPAEQQAAPAVAEKPAEPAPAPAAEKPAEPAPAPAAEKPAEPAPAPAAEKPAAAPAAPSEEDQGKLVSELMTLETIRRKSLDDHGYASLDTARKALRDGDYPLAREQYKQALDFIGNRPTTIAARQEAETGMAEAYYREAKMAMKKGDYDKALPLASQALEHGHPQAARLIETLKKEPTKVVTDASSITHRVNQEEYKTQRDEIRRHLRRSRQFYTTGEYDKALEECELVLRDQPFDTEAIELRDRLADRMKNVADVEFEATRSLMIRDVRKTWTPDRYAIESSQLPKGKNEMTSKKPVDTISGIKTAEQVIAQKLHDIVIPEVSFRPPATIIDAVEFFKQASRDYDNPETPVEQRGVNLVLKLASNSGGAAAPAADAAADPFAATAAPVNTSGAPAIQALSARFINLYDALKLVCDVTGMKFRIRGNVVMIVPVGDPDAELVTRSYNVLATLQERVGAASSEMNANKGGGGSGDSTFMTTANMENKQDWKTFFSQMGVQWPDGSSISYMATIGKLRVTNTTDNLAVFEQVLEDLNVTPRLIEIEARFVEVSQEDLNSLGFEWLLNSDYSFGVGGTVGKALGLKNYSNKQVQLTDSAGNLLYDASGNALMGYSSYQTASSTAGTTAYYYGSDSSLHATTVGSGQYALANNLNNNVGINAIDGTTYATGQRYLSTTGNPISGSEKSTNDQFMKINAFLGDADLSMILHMLSQRSDTDLLSAPKVVTKSGQEAVMKVVTEYIYPTEYQVQLSQQGSSGSGTSSGATGDPIGIVEPQNFEMREVGVILQVVPEVSAEGQMINLMLNPQVVSEPVWKNYGTKLPKTSWRQATAAEIAANPLLSVNPMIAETTYIDLPMEQPFFHVRSVQTQLSIYNGSTVVMGGLITEDRKSIDDKVPFLGDIPYLGRLFRSHSEQSTKKNLLVFVTARLVDPAGRALRIGGGESALMSGGVGQQHTSQPATPPAAPNATAEKK